MPAAANGTSEASAKAFVRYWVEALNYAGPSGDTTGLEKVSDKNCAACTAITTLIKDVTEAGGYVRGEGWTVKSTEALGSERGGVRIIEAQVAVAPQDILRKPGGDVVHFDGGSRLKTFWLDRTEGAWTVTRLDQPE